MTFTRKEVCYDRKLAFDDWAPLIIGYAGPAIRVFPGYFKKQWFREEYP